MSRLDLYTHVHKGLRVLFFDALTAVGRTDFGPESELPTLLATLRRTIRLARSHAQHEDREIHPILHRIAPVVAADLEAGHDRFDGLYREIEKILARIESATDAERISLGRRLHGQLGGLVADELLHMCSEETRANRILWAHLTDAELSAVQERILSGIAPEEMAEWIELMLPAGSTSERAELVAGLSAAVPAEAFATLTAGARFRLGEERWSETLAAAKAFAAGKPARVGAVS